MCLIIITICFFHNYIMFANNISENGAIFSFRKLTLFFRNPRRTKKITYSFSFF